MTSRTAKSVVIRAERSRRTIRRAPGAAARRSSSGRPRLQTLWRTQCRRAPLRSGWRSAREGRGRLDRRERARRRGRRPRPRGRRARRRDKRDEERRAVRVGCQRRLVVAAEDADPMPIVKTPLEPIGHSANCRGSDDPDRTPRCEKHFITIYRRAPAREYRASGVGWPTCVALHQTWARCDTDGRRTKPRSSGGRELVKMVGRTSHESPRSFPPRSTRFASLTGWQARVRQRPSAIASRLQPRRRSNPSAAGKLASWGVMTKPASPCPRFTKQPNPRSSSPARG